jgi:hypothetical protein
VQHSFAAALDRYGAGTGQARRYVRPRLPDILMGHELPKPGDGKSHDDAHDNQGSENLKERESAIQASSHQKDARAKSSGDMARPNVHQQGRHDERYKL